MSNKLPLIEPGSGCFLVSRTSFWDDEKPCEEAFWAQYVMTHRRTTDDVSELESTWMLRGFNHRVEDGGCCREEFMEDWFVKIDDIMDFVGKYGHCIVAPAHGAYPGDVEIYDARRE